MYTHATHFSSLRLHTCTRTSLPTWRNGRTLGVTSMAWTACMKAASGTFISIVPVILVVFHHSCWHECEPHDFELLSACSFFITTTAFNPRTCASTMKLSFFFSHPVQHCFVVSSICCSLNHLCQILGFLSSASQCESLGSLCMAAHNW